MLASSLAAGRPGILLSGIPGRIDRRARRNFSTGDRARAGEGDQKV
jgi:hypothetical protein